ncbi:LytTR family DNA-binding domain-containing protein [uncultured Lacinutrix sp.]|uniref:LytR/AlgR family response regulator transcription factor n=1 Tax=uncultured Lacinutrix sp. TaxID=574032 RepID=UPI002617FFAB|nr:response regulator [uncultured Lacinutrix sp.]
MIRYILVDDDPNTLRSVKNQIDKLPKEYELQHKKSFDSSKKAYQEINEEDFDLLIVDFEMPVYNGIELAQKVATNKKIIFLTSTTNNEKKVINSLDISGYLSKPFDIEEFEAILKNKVIGKINNKKTYQKGDLVILPISKNKNMGIYPEDIYFISSALVSTGHKLLNGKQVKMEKPEGNLVHFYGKNSEAIFEDIRITISDLESKLSYLGFRKINQSYLINTNYIRDIDNRNLKLYHCKEPFEISAKEKTSFLNNLNDA